MQPQKILATLAGNDPKARLEIALRSDAEGRKGITLRRLAWGGGIGWYSQQTLHLTADEAKGLLLTLRKSRETWRSQTQRYIRKVIPFPKGTGIQERRERKIASHRSEKWSIRYGDHTF